MGGKDNIFPYIVGASYQRPDAESETGGLGCGRRCGYGVRNECDSERCSGDEQTTPTGHYTRRQTENVEIVSSE